MSQLVLDSKRLPLDIAKVFNERFIGRLNIFQRSVKKKQVWIDYVLETTENKSLNMCGQIIGLTLRYNGLARCFFSWSVAAKLWMQFAE